ncbi:hypothetical protein UFOVP59_75 [uncultured Caudovirales phage]|uniref:Uncharacterized protein n=1 Tax=uncultured Caudovirales phage TaxID=2100421 RepID=A0A6J5KVE4_9CAUD|nr:hypothetical protein UFOVP59_75 [uncultured Caudovirales phage]CAB5220802.1 hypothetical protein UFOVP246_40 [uncultured Caudovirales phage]
MTRLVDTFQHNRPLFVKSRDLQSAGRFWVQGERYHWEYLKIPVEKVAILFSQGEVHHNPELEEEIAKKVSIGDGLEELEIDQLHVLVGNINAKVKENTKNPTEFIKKKCATSKIKDKQIGLIRSWRLTYSHLEN